MAHNKKPLQPYSQGDLDGLCGIYATINAVRLALGTSARHFAEEDWRELFYTLVVAADDAIGAVNATACGIDSKPYRQVLKSAVRHMAEEHEIGIEFRSVLRPKERPSVRQVVSRIGSLVQQLQTAVIVCFDGHLDHWTIIRSVSDRSLELFDSSVFSRVSIAKCRMRYEPPFPAGVEYIIQPNGLFRVSVQT